MISVITPCNRTRWLKRAYASICAQEPCSEPWEWVVLANGDVTAAEIRDFLSCHDDPIVRVEDLGEPFRRIAQVKREACRRSRGNIYVELDHDDELLPACIRRVSETFAANPNAAMVYSDCGARNEDGTLFVFSKENGWTYRVERDDPVPNAPQLIPQNICRPQFSPDHVRAWNSVHYWKIGGHSEAWQITDDIDLVCRLFCEGEIVHIPEGLYRYHMHGTNTWFVNQTVLYNELINIYATHIEPTSMVHARRNGLLMADLTGQKRPGWYPVDDVDKHAENSWYAARSLRCPAAEFRRVHAKLVPGGLFVVQMPPDDVPKAISTFADLYHPIFVHEHGADRLLHVAAVKPGYVPYSN